VPAIEALEEGAFADADVVALLAEFILVRVDVDKDEAGVRAKYGARFTPAVYFVGRDGKRIGEYEGAFEKEAIAARLKEVLEKHRSPWCGTEKAALERGAKEKKFVLLASGAKPHAKVAEALGEAADGIVLAPLEDAKRWGAEGEMWVIVDVRAEMKIEVVARIPLKDATSEALREAVTKATR
jgi:hypothetical protein